MTLLKQWSRFKPLDFGADGITGSIDGEGRIIALNSYHPRHGYVTLTAADPFPEDQRYNQAAVRAYRAGLANLPGFGMNFAEPVTAREAFLLEDAIPHIRLTFQSGASAEVTTFAVDGGAIQIWEMSGVTPSWGGRLSLQRCAYTQLTEGGPLPNPPLEMHLRFSDGVLTIENRALGWAAAIGGLPEGSGWEHWPGGPIYLHLKGSASRLCLVYGFGPTAEAAAANARWLAREDPHHQLERMLALWRVRWEGIADDPLVRRGLSYGLMMSVPVDDGICILTDHMLLPLSWNRDAYYVARALLSWRPAMANIVRRHLIWMFEQAERPDGTWARCYLANGTIKDGAFQLDQQLYPLLELAEYVLECNDRETLDLLQRHIGPVIDALLRRKSEQAMLFPTDETPADDPIALPNHLSSHILFWRTLKKLEALGVKGDWTKMADAIRQTIDEKFIADHHGCRIYAYATDGAGRHHFYHDANDLPLALAPAWGFVSADDPVWRATVEFVFSEDNVGGMYQGRLGSVHSRAPWTLGDIQELIIAQATGDQERAQRARSHLEVVAQWDRALPEAYDSETGTVFSRHWFAWPNAALSAVELGAFKG